MDRSWINNPNHVAREYVNGLNQFLDFAQNYMLVGNFSKVRCPCRKCRNNFKMTLDHVRGHLYNDGFDKSYRVWSYHGEVDNQNDDENLIDEIDHVEEDDTFLDMFSDLREAEMAGDSGEVGNDNMETTSTGGADGLRDSYMSMFEGVQRELYQGCSTFSTFSFLVKLMHVKVLNGWSNKSFDMLLELLGEAFPRPNTVPHSYYEAKKMLKELGLGFESIHACKNDCVLFWEEHKDKDSCPVCNESRYKYNVAKKKKIPHKVLRYFPLKPRLKRLFLSKHTAEEMRWHKEKRIETDGVLRHPADAVSWKEFDDQHKNFAHDPRNVRLGLSTDGFNPFGNKSNSYTTWPVLLVPYNLPPWKMMNPSYTMMSLLIPGPTAPGKEIDVYLRPLINELKCLWNEGMEVYDASTSKMFRLHAALIWTIHDFPAYGSISGWSTKGYKACPVCLDDTMSCRLRSKICYTGHRRYLDDNHPWRKNRSFNGKHESACPPRILNGDEILTQLNALPEVTFSKHSMVTGKRKRLTGDSNWVKKSIFYELEYWSVLKLRHNLDVMHIEKNICDALVGTLLSIDGKSKDTLKARLDMQDMGIRRELHLEKNGEKIKKPHASYTLALGERREFCQFIKSVRFPDDYAANISRNVKMDDGKLLNLKTHDCHVLLQRLLPVAIRKFLPKNICETLIELCDFFKKLTARTLHIKDLRKMEEDIVIILCKMEQIFPPAFFDVMIHLAVHLPREAILGGPVSSRWMYPFERYLGTLKRFVRNKARPEGSIAEVYVVNEALNFSSMYISHMETRFNRPLRNQDVPQPILDGFSVFTQKVREIGAQRNLNLPLHLRKKAHWYVLNNCKEVDTYRNEHLRILSTKVSPDSILKYHELQFPSWFRDKVVELRSLNDPNATNELYSLALGPDCQVQLYDACIINGVRYHTKSRDSNRVCQNSGVTVSSSDDGDNLEFFGVVKEVVKMFYSFGCKVYLLWCDWFQCNPKRKSVIHEFGITCIDTSKTWYDDDPFILATQAHQVYYLDDIKHGKNWKVVVKVHHRGVFEVIENEVQAENASESEQFGNSDYEPNQEVSSDVASLEVGADLEISHLCRIDIQPENIELPNSQLHILQDKNDSSSEDEDLELSSDEDEEEDILLIDDDDDSD